MIYKECNSNIWIVDCVCVSLLNPKIHQIVECCPVFFFSIKICVDTVFLKKGYRTRIITHELFTNQLRDFCQIKILSRLSGLEPIHIQQSTVDRFKQIYFFYVPLDNIRKLLATDFRYLFSIKNYKEAKMRF